ncbi:MAG: response regulator, partial [Limisphaerales bacterium]
VYGMMQRHDGNIDVESAPGKGASVRLTFPFRNDIQKTAPDSIHEQKSNAALRILCIDDEQHVLQLLSNCLSPFGHRVTTSPSGQDGLELFRAAKSDNLPFQAVITDLGMPGFDGRQVARAIKGESPETPVIMLTGWGKEMREEKETIAEVDAVIEKPPSIQRLHETLLRFSHSAGPTSAEGSYGKSV